MNLAEFLKLLHIVLAIIGFAGVIGLHTALPLARKATDVSATRFGLKMARIFDILGGAGIVLAGLVGLGLSFYQEWDFGDNTWLNISATLWLVVILVAAILLEPPLRRLQHLADAAPGPGQSEELAAEFRKPLIFATPIVITTILVVIVFLMVVKPGVDFTGIDNWPVNT